MEDDLVIPEWIRQEHLDGMSLFVGINSHVFVDAPAASGSIMSNAHEALRVFKPDCVFAAHKCAHHRPQPIPDWIRMHVSGGPSIGSLLKYDEPEHSEQLFEAPMWLVQTLPHLPCGLMDYS